ncbi:hypothetical protein MCERHM31_00794 [Methylophilaceae bacterium]
MKYNTHQALLITNGRFKGLACTVIGCDDSIKKVFVNISGLKQDKPISENTLLNFNQVRAL